MKGISHLYNDDWIISHFMYAKSNAELHRMYQIENGNVDYSAFCKHLKRLDIQTHRTYPDEVKDWIISNYSKVGSVEASRQIKDIFGLTRTPNAICHFAKSLGLKVNTQTISKINRQTHLKYKIGDIVERDGYLYIKTDDNNWMLYHQKIYQDAYGKIPSGHIVIFLNGDCSDLSLDNLCCIPRKWNGKINGIGLKSKHPVLKKASIEWCKLCELIEIEKSKLEKENDNGNTNICNL